MHVVTSMDYTRITSTQEGVVALKNFLRYGLTNEIQSYDISGREPDSEFEIVVADRLVNLGYKVKAQVGVSNYFIDLAIEDPNDSGKFILGIECDGATYHSSRSARERDRLRQDIIEKQGWRIHRIWSTDWFADPDREVEKIKQAVSTILDPNTPDAETAEEKAERIEVAIAKDEEEERRKINQRFQGGSSCPSCGALESEVETTSDFKMQCTSCDHIWEA